MPRRYPSQCIPREEWKRRVRAAHRPITVHAIGIPYHTLIEPHDDETRIDHVWINTEIPPCGRIRLSVNTLSRWNRDAGFDPRIRLGILHGTYEQKPVPILEEHPPLDYTTIEAQHPVHFETMEHDPLELLLIEKAQAAVRIEAWGELYIRDHLGIHQLHCRRASCAVPRDLIGHDGALRLYYRDQRCELLLFKFCGQA